MNRPADSLTRGVATGDTPTFADVWSKLQPVERAIISAQFCEQSRSPQSPAAVGELFIAECYANGRDGSWEVGDAKTRNRIALCFSRADAERIRDALATPTPASVPDAVRGLRPNIAFQSLIGAVQSFVAREDAGDTVAANYWRGEIASYAAALSAAPESEHPEQTCTVCRGSNPQPWFAPDELWNRVVGSPNGILCPRCFIKLAGENGVDAVWRVAPESPAPKFAITCNAIPVHDWEELSCTPNPYDVSLESGWRQCRVCGQMSTFTREAAKQDGQP